MGPLPIRGVNTLAWNFKPQSRSKKAKSTRKVATFVGEWGGVEGRERLQLPAPFLYRNVHTIHLFQIFS